MPIHDTLCLSHIQEVNQMLRLPEFPTHMRQAADRQKGQNWFIELLIFFLVYLVCSTAMSFVMIAGVIIVLLTDQSLFLEFSAAGSIRQTEQLVNSLMGSDALMLVMLFSNALMIFVVILFCVLLQKRTVASMGFVRSKALKHYLAGAGIGFLLFGAVTLLNVLTGSLSIEGISSAFSPVLFILFAIAFGIQGMAEEVLCRGYFMVSVGRRYPVIIAILLNSLVFSLLHLLNPGVSLIAVINILLVGIVFSVFFLRTGNIWGVGAMHSIWNFVQGNVFGMEVSGMKLSCSLFSSVSDPAKSFWNGGSFGAEGGFSVTIVLLIALFLLLIVPKRAGCDTATADMGNHNT